MGFKVPFEQLQKVITTPPALALLDFNKKFTMEYDASRVGLGVVLIQEGKPISYFIKGLKGRE